MADTISVADIRMGMSVVGSDGTKIGVVDEVAEDPNAPMDTPASFYFEVNSGGFLGIGATRLYIPVGVVQTVGREAITLSCTAEQAHEWYAHSPHP